MNRHKTHLKLFLFFVLLANSFYCSGQKEIENFESEQPTVGLVLSGGGAKGFAYIGMLKVLEEVNMPIDYIGGSSIGAIVAGLYSIGYSPETIEHLIRDQDWDKVISDIQKRKYLAYEEKLFSDKYIFTMPIQEDGFSLSKSISGSFNIDLMLNNLFAPAATTSDFSELPIPFLCVGTDLLTGDAVVLDSGNIARAIRASMAIPGYFTPTNYDGYLIVDGGVVNNYPAEQVKNKSIDIIIGGDVQAGLKTDRNELNTLTGILDQVISFHRVNANIKGKELTDYYIKFKMPYGMMDFNEYESIIDIGEKVAREHYSNLKKLADSINHLRVHEYVREEIERSDSIIISEIKLPALNEKHNKKLIGYFDKTDGGKFAIADIEEKMRLLQGTKRYNELHYELEAGTDNNTNLKLIAQGANKGSLSAGLHYDNTYFGSILFNVSLRNIAGGNSKFFADVVLSQNPRLYAMYIVNNGIKPGFGLETDLYSFSFPQYTEGEKVNSWKFDNISTAIFMPITIKNDFLFKAGFQYESFRFKQDVAIDTVLNAYNEFADFGNAFISLNLDTRNKVYFATKGQYIQFKAKHIFPFSEKWGDFISNSTIFYLKYLANINLAKKITFQPGVFLGYTYSTKKVTPTPYSSEISDITAVQHLFGFGGLNPTNYIEGHVPFTGLRYMEKIGQYAGIASMKLQYNYYEKLYATILTDIGFNEMRIDDISSNSFLFGYGVKLSYNSFVGPVEFSIMDSNKSSFSTFLNIGFWF